MQWRDHQWERTENLLPGKVGDRWRTGVKNPPFVEAVLWQLCEYDRFPYRIRNLVERFFVILKQIPLVAMYYGKLAARFGAFVMIAALEIWLR